MGPSGKDRGPGVSAPGREGATPVFEYTTVFGIDSHARSTTVCALRTDTGEAEFRRFAGSSPWDEAAAWMAGFPGPSLGAYESGCTGFAPARELAARGLEVVCAASSHLPSSPGSRSRKNDRADALGLARALLAGQLRPVWLPDPETEAMRDLSNALGDLRDAAKRARQRVLSFLLRKGLAWDGRTPRGGLKKPWGRDFRAWIARQSFAEPAEQAAWEAYVEAEREASEAYDRLLARAREAVAASAAYARTVAAVSQLGGVAFVGALAVCAQIGDFGRFPSGRHVTAYLGLAPSERSSGERLLNGGVTKAGCARARTCLVEGSWCYARAAAGASAAAAPGVPAEVAAHARRGSARLRRRRRAMLDRGVHPCRANCATAAELARWCWAVGLMAQRAARGEG